MNRAPDMNNDPVHPVRIRTGQGLEPLALTLGDPAGVGPEIVVKAWNALRHTGPAFVVIGDHDALASASGAGGANLQRVTQAGEASALFADKLPVFDLP